MFILIEIQTNGDQTALTPAKTYANAVDAMQEYYTTLASAIKSTVQIHTVMVIAADGKIQAAKTFNH